MAVPEGDTIARAAETLQKWLGGRELTGVEARDVVVQQRVDDLVGRTIDSVESRGKHLLIGIGDRTIHSHMRMSGSWHVYEAGAKWKKSRNHMRLILEAGDHIAVCFNAPIIQVVPTKDVDSIPGLNTLGLDLLSGIDPVEGAARIHEMLANEPIGDALLDQTAVAGLGNIWRCEALWIEKIHPRIPVNELTAEELTGLVATGARLLTTSVTDQRPELQVYKRTQQPCRRCGTLIRSQRMGRDARTAYWCPICQISPVSPQDPG